MASIKIIQRSKPLTDGSYPIFLRATKDRKSKFISLNLSSELSQWNTAKSEFRKNYPNYQQFNSTLTDIKTRAEKIFTDALAEGDDISLNEFYDRFFEYKLDKKLTFLEAFQEYINELQSSNRIGNARYFNDSKRSFSKFLNGSDMSFKEVTPKLLKKYEVWLRGNGNSDSGIAAKMRAIRAVFNDGIKKNYTKQDSYPFSVYKISKFKKTNNKRAIPSEAVKKIVNLDIDKYPHLVNSRNYFVFSYYTRGMNFYDMMMLKWSNIKDDKIHYVRKKTKTAFTIQILEPVQEILDYYKLHNNLTSYIFPILLNEDMTPNQIENRKAKTLRRYNKQLKEIAKLCGINEQLTSYVARHSFATNLKQKGVSTDIISEAMGHQNLAITQTYLKELENSVIDEAMKELLN
ncbi:site-specific integrase [Mesonia sp. K7]|uniref:site-specific integrase n=1 Tax=Mesonia sp. K7 TaxID=2218606 RepID=UPI000DA95E2F|nr:site-specific integrase [Mesonia sp. K7]PZD78527.1 site-specific integrase [Mesonia sp. K7]